MQAECKEAGVPAPTFNYDMPGLMLEFRSKDVKSSPKGLGETPGETLGKTPIQILKILSDKPTFTIPEIAKMIKKSNSATERAIRKLREADLVKRIGPARGGHWEITMKKTS
jgi:ATP-dependent DNA helicase RecG